MIDYEKIVDIMCWEKYDGETAEDVFLRYKNNINDVPNTTIIDIVHAGGLQRWAEKLNVTSQKQLEKHIIRAIRTTIAEPVFNNKKTMAIFPPLLNFFYYCQKIDRNGKMAVEAEGISDIAWNGVICKRNNDENIRSMFSNKPDKERYKAISNRIREIWGFTTKEIDAFRYFVCQTRHENHNPSLNKSLYLWGKMKGTGKTTVGRAIITILNGDKWDNFGIYESSLNKEMGYNDHDLPLAALYNCVFLDETVPKDSKKSYGLIKRMLTSNTYNYNPKFRQVITIPCRRLYIFTSNDDISDFVQDESERRFISFEIKQIPEQMTFDEIYSIWYEFCINCEREEDWKVWYDSFEHVSGLESIRIDMLKTELINRCDEIFTSVNGSYFTIKGLANILHKNEPTHEQYNTVKAMVTKYLDNCKTKSNPALFSRTQAAEIIRSMKDDSENNDEMLKQSMPF